jgi:hypothetical protein
MGAGPQDLINSIYAEWDLCDENEKDVVSIIDDKLCIMGSISPTDYKTLRKILREIRNRGNYQLQEEQS